MIKNAHITVITSTELTAMRLDDLVGCRGLVVEVLSEDRIKNRGALVLLEEPYLGEYLWFIPENSPVFPLKERDSFGLKSISFVGVVCSK